MEILETFANNKKKKKKQRKIVAHLTRNKLSHTVKVIAKTLANI